VGLLWVSRRDPDAAPAAAVPPPTAKPATLAPAPAATASRPAARPAPAAHDTRPAADPRADALRSILDTVLSEAQKAGAHPPDSAGASGQPRGKGKAHGKGKKH